MRRNTLWLLSTVAALVLLFSYRTSTMGRDTPTATVAGGAGDTGDTAPGKPETSNGATTYPGVLVRTSRGPVQVAITVTAGKITRVEVPVYPHGDREDREINAYALPILKQETLDAQSADIDTVSGATVTSGGYKRSLQAALDSAHLS